MSRTIRTTAGALAHAVSVLIDASFMTARRRHVAAPHRKKVSDGTSGTLEDSGNANPDGDFRYDGGGYIFNLSPKGLAGGTYALKFTAGNDPLVY